jgi:patatin-like phospholipase/acyl hydrolase
MEDHTSLDPRPKIEHLAITGGSLSGWGNLGILEESHKDGFWNIQEIKSIYGTSMGGILATFITLLKKTEYTSAYIYTWEILEDYFVKRPWQHVFKLEFTSIMNSFQKRGIFGKSIIEEMFAPLFNAMDISKEITMTEFFEITQIELHLFAIELKSFTLVDISYKTHPDWKVLEAVYCSACIPFLFSPYKREEQFYIDGGFLANYPLEHCINDILKSADSKIPKVGVFGINRQTLNPDHCIDETASLFDYVICIFNKIMGKLGFHKKTPFEVVPEKIALYETHLKSEFFSLYSIFQASESITMRQELLDYGKELWEQQYKECFCSNLY